MRYDAPSKLPIGGLNENLLPKEQKECCIGTKGCKDQLLISKVILRECKSRKKKTKDASFYE
jgi:hypothetical protein